MLSVKQIIIVSVGRIFFHDEAFAQTIAKYK